MTKFSKREKQWMAGVLTALMVATGVSTAVVHYQQEQEQEQRIDHLRDALGY